ncbi:concanavalin A-like lectin/glucanase domain-containing protein [Lipomyces oligophaga]|uniref:concanavalin A-like lectin/glucanase domain-containing protein n=1 Tax=Lipomyces oligophaga TaxID=45792 RepID=UPI0034CDAE1E
MVSLLRRVLGISTLGLLSQALLVRADTISCDENNLCPEDTPCCSEYGECGTGTYCLGGCDPRFSYDIESCAPQPICQNQTYTFTSMDDIVIETDYLGDADAAGWVYTGYLTTSDDNLLLTMPNQTTGTVLASTRYMWYGKYSITLKSSRGRGVVTAAIAFSDVKDEIDYEFVGADLETVQTNYYYQGTLNWTHSVNISLSDTFSNYHTYEVDWTEDSITWSVDGQQGRVLYKTDTYNSTSDAYDFPQTPSRIQISLWPGGLDTNAPGTIAWAGGEINWDSEDINEYGYFYAILQSVDITCYDPPSFATLSDSSKSYRYTDRNGTAESVAITDEDTVLGSDLANGQDMSLGASSVSSTATSSSSTPSSSSNESSSAISTSSSASSSSASSSSTSSSSSNSKRSTESASGSSSSSVSVANVSEEDASTSSSSSSTSTSTSTTASSTESTTDSETSTSSSSEASSSADSSATSADGSGFTQNTQETTSANAANIAVLPLSSMGVMQLVLFLSGFLFVF